jgi:hypothetical protein
MDYKDTSIISLKLSQVWRYRPIMPALWRLRQKTASLKPAWTTEQDPVSKNQ